MDNIREEIRQLFLDAEREIQMPESWIGYWGKWDKLKQLINDAVDELKETEDEIYNQQEELDSLKDKNDDYERAIKDAIDSLIYNIDIEDALKQLRSVL